MANHKSAIKRVKQDQKKNIRNRIMKTKIKNAVKLLMDAKENKPEEVATALNDAKSTIDKAAKKGTIHRNTAARKISRLTKAVSAA